jgi:3,4-dihydroxy 2-butanone 4-phosphate synthase/GTP cyclohydrolase II
MQSDKIFVNIYAETILPTMYGEFKVLVFHNNVDEKEHLAIIKGNISDGEPVLIRIHSECYTSEVLGSLKCDCREQLQTALKTIHDEGSGIILYMRQEGRGIGLGNKIRAYALQEQGYDTVEANHILGFPDDLRRYDIAAAMLKHLGVETVRLLTNNPKKIEGLEENGIQVVERVPLVIQPNPINKHYLVTKARKSGHLLVFDENDELNFIKNN